MRPASLYIKFNNYRVKLIKLAVAIYGIEREREEGRKGGRKEGRKAAD